MKYEVTQQSAQQAVVKVSDRLDANTAATFKAGLRDTVASGLTRLVVDMQAVSFIDSSGLSALVSGFRAAREKNGTILLANVGPQTQLALEMTRLNRVFPVYANVTQALEKL